MSVAPLIKDWCRLAAGAWIKVVIPSSLFLAFAVNGSWVDERAALTTLEDVSTAVRAVSQGLNLRGVGDVVMANEDVESDVQDSSPESSPKDAGNEAEKSRVGLKVVVVHFQGGALYALGLIRADHGEGIKQFLHDSLRNTNVEVIQHGACLSLGLASLGTTDEDIFEDMKNVLYINSVVAGEATGYRRGAIIWKLLELTR
ncbi:hypothetical protein Droror1_Dr00027558 [Drosera rotundifolia]